MTPQPKKAAKKIKVHAVVKGWRKIAGTPPTLCGIENQGAMLSVASLFDGSMENVTCVSCIRSAGRKGTSHGE